MAKAGGITPTQYAYGGGSNAAAVIASQPPVSQTEPSTQPGGAGSGGGGTGSSEGGAGSGGRHGTETTAQPLVGLAGASASPASSFDALHRAVPTDALWAIGLAVACGLAAWLVRRGSA
jgi:hypothetical protein